MKWWSFNRCKFIHKNLLGKIPEQLERKWRGLLVVKDEEDPRTGPLGSNNLVLLPSGMSFGPGLLIVTQVPEEWNGCYNTSSIYKDYVDQIKWFWKLIPQLWSLCYMCTVLLSHTLDWWCFWGLQLEQDILWSWPVLLPLHPLALIGLLLVEITKLPPTRLLFCISL